MRIKSKKYTLHTEKSLSIHNYSSCLSKICKYTLFIQNRYLFYTSSTSLSTFYFCVLSRILLTSVNIFPNFWQNLKKSKSNSSNSCIAPVLPTFWMCHEHVSARVLATCCHKRNFCTESNMSHSNGFHRTFSFFAPFSENDFKGLGTWVFFHSSSFLR